MEIKLKPLSQAAIPRALDRAVRYRLLNEPEQAESICRDILRVSPDHQEALITLLLSLTDQLNRAEDHHTRASDLLPRLKDEYQRTYYTGLIWERRARAKLRQHFPGSEQVAQNWLREAMRWYEQAEKLRPSGNDDALLRWNACARIISDRKLAPSPEDSFHPLLE